jgi:hypothetical protein
MRLRAIILAGVACVFATDLPVQGADSKSVPIFATSPVTAWVPSRPAGDNFLPPPSGPGPVVDDPAHPYAPNQGTAGQAAFHVGDLSNPILKPWAVAQMKKANEAASSGKEAFEARASCRPGGVPGFLVMGRVNPLYFVQAPNEVVMINEGGPEVRHIHLNVPHSAHPTPSPYGESVGHYEGRDTLVIDTIGLADNTFIDNYRTPHTTQLHVVERFTLTDGGKTLQVSIAVDDPGAFNMPWSARQIYHRSHEEPILETICAENNNVIFDAAVSPIPQADKPDF